MHLALISTFDARNVQSWSGIPYHIAKGLAQHVDKLSVLPPIEPPRTLSDAVQKAGSRLKGTSYLRLHTERFAQKVGETATRQIRSVQPDAVLSVGSLPLSYLDAACPVGFWIDATFESNLHFYEGYAGLPADAVNAGHRIEAAALRRADVATYASAYAARSATGYYGTPSERVAVVPFGSNLATPPVAEEVERAIESRAPRPVRLLFLGGDWVRKGGDVAVRVADELHAAGIPVVLDVAGVVPPLDRPRPYVRLHGFLRKDVPAERVTLERLLTESHVLLMPVRAEAFGCVFCEAAAYGIPSLSTRIGGVPSAVEDGVSGLLFDPRPSPTDIAEALVDLLNQPGAYADLARSARAHYESRLNWDVATKTVVSRFESLRSHG